MKKINGISENYYLIHLLAHEVVDPKGQISDGPLAEGLRVGEPQSFRQCDDRLQHGRRRQSWPPGNPSPTNRSARFRHIAAGVILLLLLFNRLPRQSPAQHVVQHHRRSGRRRHCPRRHRRSREQRSRADTTASRNGRNHLHHPHKE